MFLTIFSYIIAILVKLLIAYLFLLNKTCKKLFLSFFFKNRSYYNNVIIIIKIRIVLSVRVFSKAVHSFR